MVVGYPNYAVSNCGRVKSLNRNLVLARRTGGRGYLYVDLWNEGKHRNIPIHRLVAEAFLPNPENLPCIDHIDRVITNNHVDNLQWVTYGTNNHRSLKRFDNRSGYKGVCFHRAAKKWQCRISRNRVVHTSYH
ncbi:MAG: hypothetical protein EB117_18095, partial [Betaproteobacteria bacterium]|nr:hypothetical protein [Betaproteobacteria bacterium]